MSKPSFFCSSLALKTVLELRYGHAIAGSRKH